MKLQRPRFTRRTLYIAAGIGTILLAGGITWLVLSSTKKPVQTQASQTQTTGEQAKMPSDDTILLTATGDMLAHDSVNQNAKTVDGYDYTPFFKHVKQFTSMGDIRFCNQEGLSAGEAYGITGYPTFNAPKAFPRDLQKIGCNTINLANNHMADKGQAAIDETVASWRDLKPMAVSGANATPAERDTVQILDVKGVKVAFVTFNEINNNQGAAEHSITMLSEPIVAQLMHKAAETADFVMVSVHWGSYEDSTVVGPIQEQWTKKLTDLGADVIIGTGPHVLQRTEWQPRADGHKTLVWYSIGNFLSTQLTLEELTGGIAMMRLEKMDDTVRITKVGFLPTYMSYDWPAADRAAEKLSTRTNLALYPLDQAAAPLQRSGFGVTPERLKKLVRERLGTDVTILTSKTAISF